MAPAAHRLLLMRHAEAAEGAGVRGDHERPLTEYGIAQAEAAGAALRARGVTVDKVLCSDAVRTEQTLAALAVEADLELTREIYNAGSDTLLELVRLLDEEVGTALIIGHGPGLPRLASELSGPESNQGLLDLINRGFPTATVAEISVDCRWAEMQVGRLVWLHRAIG